VFNSQKIFNTFYFRFQRQDDDGSADYPEQDETEKALGLPNNAKSIRVKYFSTPDLFMPSRSNDIPPPFQYCLKIYIGKI
jgi:hypothetical protein